MKFLATPPRIVRKLTSLRPSNLTQAKGDSVTLMGILFRLRLIKFLIHSTPTILAQRVPKMVFRISLPHVKYNKTKANALVSVFAEGERFELSDPVKSLLFSRQVQSTTLPSLQCLHYVGGRFTSSSLHLVNIGASAL